MTAKRIVIIVNKWWECDPITSVLLHDKARPAEIKDLKAVRYPTQRVKWKVGDEVPSDPEALPRLTFTVGAASVELWCLEELMNRSVNSSSSAEKARVLPGAINYGGTQPVMVIAMGTAGIVAKENMNGSVVVGSSVFIHDAFPESIATGMWKPPQPDMLIAYAKGAVTIGGLKDFERLPAEGRFMVPPIAPAVPMRLVFGNGYISVGIVNVTNYDDYIWADDAAIQEFKQKAVHGHIGSVETTHGIIRSASDAPFIFISGITDAEGAFDYQVAPRVYAQNTACAHNAGVALAWLLPSIANL